MRLSRMVFVLVGAFVLIVMGSPVAIPQGPPPTVTVEIQAGTSSPLGIVPGTDGANFVYQYTINDGDSITDTLPINLCVTAESGSWTSFKLSFGTPAGSLASSVTVPPDTTFTQSGLGTLPDCTLVDINILTGALNLSDPNTAETREANITIAFRDKIPSHLNTSFSPNRFLIKIRVTINPAANDTSCFITDSSGNLLTDCLGVPVTESGSDAGRFSIVVNKRRNIEVATNPGQFYYNILWENQSASPQTVAISFELTGVIPKGAQAIHAWVFPPSFSGISMEDFEVVNSGIPGGSDGVIENISVPAGWTLWVNYHVEWENLGGPSPSNCATNCPDANQPFYITGTISGGVSRECTAGAKGYKK